MTDHNGDQKLEQVLQDWAQRRQQRKDLQPLEQRILDRLAEVRAPAGEPLPAPKSTGPAGNSQTWALWISLGTLAVTLLIICKVFIFSGGREDDMPRTETDLPPQFAWLQESQLADKAVLLREMGRVFEDRLQWVIETNGRVLLEVQDPNGRQDRSPAAAAYVVRIVVARQDSPQSPWTPVWAADVVARQEDLVHLTADSAGMPEGVELALWVYPVDEQMIAVDSDLTLAGLPIESQFSGLQRSGVPLAVHAATEDGVQYQVFQTVVCLDGEV